MEIYSIGFTKTSAEHFFGRLKRAGVRRLLDVRLNNRSQLAAFAKRDDLAYFLRELIGAEYRHEPMLAPTQDILDDYKKRHSMPWREYEERYLDLLAVRKVERRIDLAEFEVPTALLCSEATPEYCHRRLAIQYLQRFRADIRPVHL